MIEVIFQRKQNQWILFQSKGHSGFRDSGQDIVCSAISAIVQTALLGILAFDKEIVEYNMQEGFLECNLVKKSANDFELQIQGIVTTAALGCLNIAIQYPAFVTVKFIGIPDWKNCKEYTLQNYNQFIELIK